MGPALLWQLVRIHDSEGCRARQSTWVGLLCLALATYQNPGLRSLQSTPEHMGCSALLWQLIRIQDSEACRARQSTWVALPCSGNLPESRPPTLAEHARAHGLLCLALATYQNPGLRRLQSTPEHMGCSALLWQLIRIQDSEAC